MTRTQPPLAPPVIGEAKCDVLVVGLGPVGQLLSLLLGRQGVSVIAIDRAHEPHDSPRAAVIDDEVLRILQSAGVDETVLANSQVQEEVSFVTHRGRKVVLLRPVDGTQGHPPLVSINQPAIERALVERIENTPGVELRWRRELDRLDQDLHGTEATVRAPEGKRERIRAHWMIGCDGGGSLVRQLLGIEFGGSTFRQRWLVVDVRVDRPLASVPHPHFYGDRRRPIVSLPMSPGRHRWEWMLHPGEDPDPFVEPGALRARIEPWLNGESVEIERSAVYTFHARMAARWRERQVLLAGDAAHVMPPFAGQGFSSGARDAANLSWKLVAVLGGAPESLLDTYELERRPHVQAMTRLALTLGSFVQTTNRGTAAVRDTWLNALVASGIAGWMQNRIKPVPAYADGAFAVRPHRLPFQRVVGSQFPQPRVQVAEKLVRLDDLIGPRWCGLSLPGTNVETLTALGLPVLVASHDFHDVEGVISHWLSSHDASWVLLRPDRFVYALGGTGSADAAMASDQLHRHLGPVST